MRFAYMGIIDRPLRHSDIPAKYGKRWNSSRYRPNYDREIDCSILRRFQKIACRKNALELSDSVNIAIGYFLELSPCKVEL